MKSICVFCGSNIGVEPAYKEQAIALGKLMAERNIRLVYGGGKVGLMGTIADAVMEEGGEVTGIIPEFLAMKEVAHKGITEMITVQSMHERKLKMSELADAFIAMPGGIGTLEEICEIYTWSVLALHKKPMGLLNVKDYYGPLMGFFDKMVDQRFLHKGNRELVVSHEDPKSLVDHLSEYEALPSEKWFDRAKL